MITKIATIFFSILLITACGKKCKDAADVARTKPKDPALMYIWRYTDNLIIKKTDKMKPDSGFISFKPNGDENSGTEFKDLNAVPNQWYVNNNIIMDHYCTENLPQDITLAKYFIRNDTLFLNYSNGDHFNPTQTYVHHWKY